MNDKPRYPKSLKELKAYVKERAAASPDGKIGAKECREIVASTIGMAYQSVLVMLFQDEDVKNYVTFPFVFDKKPEFNFEVCFRRHDGSWPSGPAFDAITAEARVIQAQHKIVAMTDRIAKLRTALLDIRGQGSDCPAAMAGDEAEFYRRQLAACISPAAQAIAWDDDAARGTT